MLTGLTLTPASMTGPCQTSTGKVTLSGKALMAGVAINLANANTAARLPSSVTVPAGATYATFAVTPAQVTVRTVGSVTAVPANANLGTTYPF